MPMMKTTGFSKEKARNALSKYGLDVLVVSSPENIFYTSGFPSRHAEHNPTIFDTMNQFPMFIVIGRDGEETAIGWEIVGDVPTWIRDFRGVWSRQKALDYLTSVVSEKRQANSGSGKVGVESTIPLFAYKALERSIGDERVQFADDLLNEMRLIKTAEEIAVMRRAAKVAEDATMRVIEALHPGVSDLELLEIAKITMLKGGALGWAGLSLQLPDQSEFAPGTGRKIKAGEVVSMDFGAIVDGYSSDMFRQASLGPVPQAAKIAFDRALATQRLCEQKVKPGVTFGDIYDLSARNYAKLGGELRSMAGHSIGIQTEETPLIKEGVATRFAKDMVITLEFSEWVGKWRIGIEDMYIVREDGVEKMMTIPSEIFAR